MTADVTGLVDALLDKAQRDHPGIEYSILMAAENTLLLPVHGDALRREANGQDGQYSGHVYRDVLIVDIPGLDESLIIASPVVGTIPEAAGATTYVGDLQSGEISTEFPQ